MYWLSPVLLVSLALHGLAMVIPVPEKEAVVEELDVELPDPIQVTELPLKPAPDPDPFPAQIFTPAPPPAVVAPPPPAPIVQQPAPIIQQPIQQPVQPPTAPVEPEPIEPEPQLPPAQDPQQTPDPQQQPPTNETSAQKPEKLPAEPQPYTREDDATAARNAQLNGGLFASQYGQSKSINTPLELNYPAAGKCYEEGPELQVFFLISIDQYGNVTVDEETSQDAVVIAKTSGYEDIDQWILDNLGFELPAESFAQLPDISSGDVSDWLNSSYRLQNDPEPFLPDGADQAPFAVTATVTIEDNGCDSEL